MTYEAELYKKIKEERLEAFRYATEISKEAKIKNINIPDLIAELARVYRIDGEMFVEKELMKEGVYYGDD